MCKLNNRDCNASGTTIEDKAPPIQRFLMKRIMKTYCSLMKGANESKIKILVNRRCCILMTYLAIGRGGKVGHASWSRSKWYFDQQLLWMNWNERKTGMQKPMTFNCDAECFEMDFFHALGCTFIFNSNNSNENNLTNFTFPELAVKRNITCSLDK